MATGGYGDGGYGDSGYGDGVIDVAESAISATEIDHIAQGLSRVLKQYQESPKLRAFLTANLTLSNQIEAVLQSMFDLPSVDLMSGVNLDTIGDLVGQSRYLKNTIELVYFGFSDTPSAQGFGEEGEPSIGSRFYEEGENYLQTSVLEDAEYRFVIKARIIKNSSISTPESILAALAYLFNTRSVNIDDNGGMAISLVVGRLLTPIEIVLVTKINLLPRPTGVNIDGIVHYDASNYFGFADQTSALPFGEEGVLNVGGKLAEELVVQNTFPL